MNKKNIIILVISTIILIGAILAFIYMKNLSDNKPKTIISNTSKTAKEEAKFYFYDVDGEKFSLKDFSDKPSVILFWKSDVSESYDIIELLEKYYEEHKDLVNFIVINTNDPDLKIVENTKAAEFSLPMYFDTDLTAKNEFNVQIIPAIYFTNESGEIEQEFSLSITEDELSANLELLENNL